MNQLNPVRVGAVNYLNTKPLVHQLESLVPGIKLSFDLPSRLAQQLSDQQLDVALIPSVEFFRDAKNYRIISDACIACRGPVWSVKLFCRKPASQIKTLALDEGSRTSAALVQILLKEKYNVTPELLPLPIGSGIEDSEADALLLIGDRAMHSPLAQFEEIWDLGDCWNRWTELPFVFAMWVARKDFHYPQLETSLQTARDRGLSEALRIAEQESAKVALTVPECLTYFQNYLYFYLGPLEMAGLKKFYELARNQNLVPQGLDWSNYDCETAR